MIEGFKLIEKYTSERITNELDKLGILYRSFSRIKDIDSIKEKIERKKANSAYKIGGKLMQDSIGIRIVTYFKDDIELVYHILKSKLQFIDEQIDMHDIDVFKPKRTNIICKMNKEEIEIFNSVKAAMKDKKEIYSLLDNTFELQLRTILSEGWHEIDHSLRYKCKEDWKNFNETARMFNGIYANLETSDSVMKNLFNELAYKNYKNSNWSAMLRNKFRLKFKNTTISDELSSVMTINKDIGKKIIKLDRNTILQRISDLNIHLPITMNNFIHIVNKIELKNEEIERHIPELLKDHLAQYFSV